MRAHFGYLLRLDPLPLASLQLELRHHSMHQTLPQASPNVWLGLSLGRCQCVFKVGWGRLGGGLGFFRVGLRLARVGLGIV